LLHSAYTNPAQFADAELDALLDRFTGPNSQEERKAIYAEIRAKLSDELPYYCLFYKTYGAAAAPSLSGDMNPSFYNFYRGCGQWVSVYEKAPEE
jgi:peptide/nickel transport system substrate-binding protein